MGNITNEERLRRESVRTAEVAVAEAAHRATAEASVGEVVAPSGKVITRDSRKGFGNQSQKLARPARAGYHRHWFNDTPGRISHALECGWVHVKNEINGSNETEVVGVAQIGGALHAYLLEIPEEWYRDDMAEQERTNASKEEAIKGGVEAKDAKDRSAFYPTAQGRHLQISRK